ncbi:hypothetical protein [Rubrivirga marina]|uniref:DUF1508 domain-containing protein n=1 Tax=Rubrivirga marina TaxID=1196024 RepID=A0A271J0K8_9BACT|nr:hypothetical protein [Rubrivirga marina]PAP76584.1 hypothetical protein BSZ37_09095 [Rubrivirga marina]
MSPSRAVFAHRGFQLRLRAEAGTFAFEIRDRDLTLHTSAPDFRSPHAAERAARRFVDDALGAFAAASNAYAA